MYAPGLVFVVLILVGPRGVLLGDDGVEAVLLALLGDRAAAVAAVGARDGGERRRRLLRLVRRGAATAIRGRCFCHRARLLRRRRRTSVVGHSAPVVPGRRKHVWLAGVSNLPSPRR